MGSLKYTPLRHKILSEVRARRIVMYIGLQRSLIRKPSGDGCEQWLKGPEKRTAETLQHLISYDRVSYPRCGTYLTEAGRTLLAEWDEKHGKVELA
jgi:hypothetical protein